MPYNSRILSLDRVPQAFPVIQTLTDLSLQRWHQYATLRLASRESNPESAGIVAIENDRGYIHGLFGYRTDFDLKCGRVLLCEYLVALGMLDSGPIFERLVSTMEDIARDRDCRAIHVRVPLGSFSASDGSTKLTNLLQTAGHTAETMELCRPLTRDHA